MRGRGLPPGASLAIAVDYEAACDSPGALPGEIIATIEETGWQRGCSEANGPAPSPARPFAGG